MFRKPQERLSDCCKKRIFILVRAISVFGKAHLCIVFVIPINFKWTFAQEYHALNYMFEKICVLYFTEIDKLREY